MERMMLFIGLALNATPAEIECLHDSIDNFYSRDLNGGLSPQELQNLSTATPGATIVTAAATSTESGKPEGLDAEGLPWDERIHSSNQKKSDNGVWVKRRGVDDAVRNRIKAEIRATLAGAGAAAATTTVVTSPTPNTGVVAVPGANVAAMPGLPGATAAPQLDPTYAKLVDIITRNLITPANPQGKINDAWVAQVLTQFGIADGNLQNAAHNIPACQAAIDGMATVGVA